MPASLIDGKAAAERLQARIAKAAQILSAPPCLAVVLVGEDPASQVYVRNKGRSAAACGFRVVDVKLPAETATAALLERLDALDADPSVNGILVQLPLPKAIDQRAVIARIDPRKDVDGFHVVNAGRLFTGQDSLVPCTPQGCMILLRETLGDLRGREAVVIGRSNIVGKPMAQLLLAADCTVTMAHSKTRDLPGIARRADILVAAIGRPLAVKADWIKPGAAVIDVGINRAVDASGKARVVGDVDFAQAREVAGAITPVPGGVGPMTIACLLRNTLLAACDQAGRARPEV
ncbi:MAG: bifunctional methylenetetrahydrofolate dehydrogenase/methenyltetrahydrofolate cyclohydrolase FolD [Alphaproteobacteria bacterium]|nr:bifunctional methylenetetrahydrofolate dehydrogenase/methenyltetrahydrofolate cyclohydrolase FolD [Alphaproteobacteria bacterium]